MILLRNIISILGIDKSISFTILARIIQALSGVISIIFVAKYLDISEQGFYYTFGSIAAIQVFFELGLNGIITQFSAHEYSYIKWDNKIISEENKKHLSRLSSFLHFISKWYSYFAIILFITLVSTGFIFFNKYGSGNNINWISPWIILTIGTTLNLQTTPILSFLEGLGKVKEIAIFRFYQQSLSLLIITVGLISGLKLYILGINSIFIAIYAAVYIYNGELKSILKRIWEHTIKESISYKKEIFPYQWRIAISWISGYFIFQLFNPVIFATEGAESAGRMGMTLTALNGVQSLSLSWITTKIPLLSGLIAQKNHSLLDQTFKKIQSQAAVINFTCLTCLLILVSLIRYFNLTIGEINIGNRFIKTLPMVLMMISLFISQYINSWATYLRCHKSEPFLIYSITNAILCTFSTIYLGNKFGIIGITSGYCLINLSIFFWAKKIFHDKKAEWHKKN